MLIVANAFLGKSVLFISSTFDNLFSFSLRIVTCVKCVKCKLMFRDCVTSFVVIFPIVSCVCKFSHASCL